jgi:ketosteroid isomerase-like protein
MSNVSTIQEIYGAFGRGDVPAILERLADDVEWDTDDTSGTPLLQPRRGRDDVAGFFQTLGGMDFTKFEPTAFLESGNIVVALIDIEFTVKATGKRVAQLDEAHIWRFAPDGKIASFRHRVDTHSHHLAFKT